ncbi:MAG: hypothetical protein SGI71_02715 [Verrucomicrobiota bacterium]|nr:hypothetical protein [Verrucomicrobiota bacterium]
MKSISNILFILALFSLSQVAGFAADKQVLLTSLTPSDSEFGSYVFSFETMARTGEKAENTIIAGSWGNVAHYKDGLKIVPEITIKALPEGKQYTVGMMDVFASSGEFKTGVGLLAATWNGYHWVEYDIPAGALLFTANVLFGDDAHYFDWRDLKTNQQGFTAAEIDGKEVYRKDFQRLGLERGSGGDLDSMAIEIPKGAKKIRFLVETSAWGDQGTTELIINEGKFVFVKK